MASAGTPIVRQRLRRDTLCSAGETSVSANSKLSAIGPLLAHYPGLGNALR
jgi:hypothetical protein